MPDGTYYSVQIHAGSLAWTSYSTWEVRRKHICTGRTLWPHRQLPQGAQTTAEEQEIKSYQKKNQIWHINVIEFAGENIIVHKKLLMYIMYNFCQHTYMQVVSHVEGKCMICGFRWKAEYSVETSAILYYIFAVGDQFAMDHFCY